MNGRERLHVIVWVVPVLLSIICFNNNMKLTHARDINAELGKNYTGAVSDGGLDIYSFSKQVANMSHAIQVMVLSNNATIDMPVLFVVRQQKSIMSWQVPYSVDKTEYNLVNRTLCPEELISDYIHDFYIDISSSSTNPVHYNLIAVLVDTFLLSLNKEVHIQAAPSQPQIYLYQFNKSNHEVFIRFTSEDHICAVVAIQDADVCPTFDSPNVGYNGVFQTMTTKAGITVDDSYYLNGFYIVIFIESDDTLCKSDANVQSITRARRDSSDHSRSKKLTVKVEPLVSAETYVTAVVVSIAVFLLFYILAGVVLLVLFLKNRSSVITYSKEEHDPILGNNQTGDPPLSSSGTTLASSDNSYQYGTGVDKHWGPPRVRELDDIHNNDSDSTIDEDDIDWLPDIEHEKDIYRTKPLLCVADLARKKHKRLSKKFKLYYWNLITIAIFYAVPVIQLVITYQKVFNTSGNEDLCYFNFWCSRPAGVLTAFNNVFSNVGFILLGLLLILLVYRRDLIHRKKLRNYDKYARTCGIPKHFGLFYAIGFALMIEGIMSACYHVCPNWTNFQFDTAFMYGLAFLGMLKLYQNRHPDINPNSYAAYTLLAIIVAVAVIGVLFHEIWFWVLFTSLYLFVSIYITCQLYFMGTVKLDLGIIKRAYMIVKTDLCCNCSQPLYFDRFMLLTIGNFVNLSMALFGVIKMPKDFATFLLAIFIINLLLYSAFYCIMKIRTGERIRPVAVIYSCCSLISWVFALYFFQEWVTSWELSPARGREMNEDCRILNFYDDHDIWHFLSSSSMFFSFLGVLTIDDDLDMTPRDKIAVF